MSSNDTISAVGRSDNVTSVSDAPTSNTTSLPTSQQEGPLPETESHESSVVECVPGQTLGYMLVRQPNITSVAYINNPYLIRWDYTGTVSKEPSFVDIYLQQVAPGVRVTWKNQIAKNVTGRYYWWQPKGLLDGKYKVRIVPNGKETFNIKATEQPCFENGEAVPSVSSTFKMFNVKSSDIDSVGTTKFDPTSSAIRHDISTSTMMLWLIILLILVK